MIFAFSTLLLSDAFSLLKLPLKEIMKKFVLMLDLQEDTDKRRALKAVSTLSGIDEITIDMKAKKLIVIGTVDPVMVVSKLRKKNWSTSIISVGPAKEEEKKKENPKKEETAKEKKPEPQQLDPATLQYRPYYPSVGTYYYGHHSIEENPNACVIS